MLRVEVKNVKMPENAVLEVFRPALRRWVCVGKALELPSVGRALCIPYRNRPRLREQVSLPLVVIEWAERWGAQRIIVRYDLERICLEMPMSEARRLGAVEVFGGQGELFLPLSRFREIEWTDWAFVTTPVVRLGRTPGEFPRQLRLEGLVA